MRSCRMSARIGKNLILFSNQRMVADLSERGERANRQPLLRLMNSAQRGNIAYIHKLGRLNGSILHASQKIDAAGLDDRTVLQLRQCRVNRAAIRERQAVHAKLLPGTGCFSAARTTAGVIGVWRMRTPIAL